MKKLILLIILLMMPLAMAHEEGSIIDDLDEIRENYNAGLPAPGFLITLFGNERMSVFIGDDLVIGAVTNDGLLEVLQEGVVDNPTLNVFTDEETIEEILTADNPFQAMSDALDDGSLSYKALTFGNKLKFGFGRAVVKVVSWFR